jgi:hypothetical protein
MAENKQAPKNIYFKLNQSEATVWRSDDGTVELSSPKATKEGLKFLYGKVPNDDTNHAFKQVERSVSCNLLIQVTKKEYDVAIGNTEKLPIMDLNGKIEKDGAMKRKCDSILKLKGKDGIKQIEKYIEGLNDPNALSHMIQLETHGENRSEVLHVLDVALRRSNGNGISDVIAEGGTNTYDFTKDQVNLDPGQAPAEETQAE